MKPVMLTLFSDASFCPKTGAAGWGAWAIRDGWHSGRFMGGPLRRELVTPNSAELCGIASALHNLNQAGALDGVESIIVQCDSTVALGMIYGGVPSASLAKQKAKNDVGKIRPVHWNKWRPIDKEALESIKAVVGNRPVWLRHVRGHQATDNGRSWVNEQCDAEAKRHMNAMREERRAVEHFEAMT